MTVDGRPGTLHTDAVITNRSPAGYERFTAILHSVFHFADGDIYASGFVDSAGKGDRSEIIGGSGVYEGATGNVAGSDDREVLTLRP